MEGVDPTCFKQSPTAPVPKNKKIIMSEQLLSCHPAKQGDEVLWKASERLSAPPFPACLQI